jgi:hypothetical protein
LFSTLALVHARTSGKPAPDTVKTTSVWAGSAVWSGSITRAALRN